MRLLLDECTPRRPKRDFAGHAVSTVEEAGLKGLKNGQLLRAAAGSFDVLVTVDQNLPHQQNLSSLNLAILLLIAGSNRYQDIQPLVAKALDSLKQIAPGEIVRITRIVEDN
jgi:predicted nuclease of predicted toxin-antitoxin system